MSEYSETIGIPWKELIQWNDLLRAERTDYAVWDFEEESVVFSLKVTFEDGMTGVVQIRTEKKESGDLIAEALLLNKDGKEITFTTHYTACPYRVDYGEKKIRGQGPYQELDGTWYLYNGDDVYCIQVIACA